MQKVKSETHSCSFPFFLPDCSEVFWTLLFRALCVLCWLCIGCLSVSDNLSWLWEGCSVTTEVTDSTLPFYSPHVFYPCFPFHTNVFAQTHFCFLYSSALGIGLLLHTTRYFDVSLWSCLSTACDASPYFLLPQPLNTAVLHGGTDKLPKPIMHRHIHSVPVIRKARMVTGTVFMFAFGRNAKTPILH